VDHQERIYQLEDLLKQRDHTILELRAERDAAYALVAEMKEQIQDARENRERWIDAFNMVRNDKGKWEWSEQMTHEIHQSMRTSNELALIRQRWDEIVPKYNAAVAPKLRNLGRPLQASKAQRADVLARRKAGQSLRSIADDTNLGLQTVRTILDVNCGVDRSRWARLRRNAPLDKMERLEQAKLRRLLRARLTLPAAINAIEGEAAELLQRAKGLR
jgi:predicted transcriptional regulator